MSEITKIHDHFTRYLLSIPETVDALLRERLPEELSALLTPDPPIPVDGSFIDGEFRDHLTDRLYQVRTLDGIEVLLYTLLEHKSWPDRKVGWQLYRYIARILEKWEKDHPNWVQLPPIICLVVYHGETEWKIPDQFQSLMGGSELLRPYLPNFRFVVVDLGKIANRQLSADPRLCVGLLVLKYVFRKKEQPDIMEEIGLRLRDAQDIVYQVIRYIILTYENADDAAIRKLIQIAQPEEETKMMSKFARDILSKGKQEGQKEATATVLLKQIRRKFGQVPDEITEKVTAAKLELIETWVENILFANSLDDVFAS